MGVGAIFISSLAVHRLPEPSSSSPGSQPELLASMLEPIVSFVVLASIIIRVWLLLYPRLAHILSDGLSIPFFNLGVSIRRSLSITVTSTRTRVWPDWTLDINRVEPMQEQTASGVAIQGSQASERLQASKRSSTVEVVEVEAATTVQRQVVADVEASGEAKAVRFSSE